MATFYLSLCSKELDILMMAGFDEIALYLLLKKLADFKTGSIGIHPQSKTNCEKLAEAMSRPSSQGKPALTLDRQQIHRLLQRMQLRGLVKLEPYTGDNIVLTLPISPMKYDKKVDTAESAPSKASREKLQQDELPGTSGTLADVDPEDFFCDSLSTDNTFNTISTYSNEDIESSGEDENQPLSVTEITELMVSRRTIRHPNTLTSKALYRLWVDHKVMKGELIKALEEAEDGFNVDLSPFAIDKILKRQRKQAKQNGGLVL